MRTQIGGKKFFFFHIQKKVKNWIRKLAQSKCTTNKYASAFLGSTEKSAMTSCVLYQTSYIISALGKKRLANVA